MADIKMASTSTYPDNYPTWGFEYIDGVVPYITGTAEDQQRAELACFMQRGAISELPYSGPDWLAFFTDKISFGDLDSMLQAALSSADSSSFYPVYSASGDKLITTVQRRANNV